MKKSLYSILLVITLFIISSTQEVAFAEEITTENNELVPENEVLVDEITETDSTEQTDESLIITPATIDNENYYPGTKTYMKVGDILYSSKSFAASTRIVGHVAIVGPDYRIYHVNPAGTEAGKKDTLTTYRYRHDPGETIYVYRPSKGATGAADWASYTYSFAKNYDIINLQPLSTLSPNYCSKFIWQAFYYGSSIDLTHIGLTGSSKTWVTPSHVKNSSIMTYITSFSSH